MGLRLQDTFLFGGLLAALACAACGRTPSLSKHQDDDGAELGEVPADNPKLGAVSDVAFVFAAPRNSARKLGYLHAGALVPRSLDKLENEDCPDGWYAVRPRGFVCSGKGATTRLEHPTLAAMALQPRLDDALPYAYARAPAALALLERSTDNSVSSAGRLAKGSHLAVVGSWTAPDESHEPQRLGLLTTGRFVRAAELAAASPSPFVGVQLTETVSLPVAFVVKRGVRAWKVEGGTPAPQEEFAYHATLRLTGRFRTVAGERFYALADGRWVRHKDATVVLARHEMPDFAREGTRWVDVSVLANTAVLYEGEKAVYATLVSVGRDRLGEPESTASTPRGTFDVVAKHVTRRDKNPLQDASGAALYDVPWALELSNGRVLHAALHHDRFGIEHTDGDIHLSPQDAAVVFRWATPELPEGWHSARSWDEPETPKTLVHVRK